MEDEKYLIDALVALERDFVPGNEALASRVDALREQEQYYLIEPFLNFIDDALTELDRGEYGGFAGELASSGIVRPVADYLRLSGSAGFSAEECARALLLTYFARAANAVIYRAGREYGALGLDELGTPSAASIYSALTGRDAFSKAGNGLVQIYGIDYSEAGRPFLSAEMDGSGSLRGGLMWEDAGELAFLREILPDYVNEL